MTARLPLVLIPGLLCDAALWRHQLEHLADLADIIVADVSGADSMAGMAEAVLAQAPEGRFALAGHSMGGYVSLELMRRAAERVSRLALIGTSARPETEEGRAQRHARLAETEYGDFHGVNRGLLPMLIHHDRLDDAALTETIMAMSRRIGRDGFVREQTAIIGRADSRARLGDIVVPTLVLVGREDVLNPLDRHEELADRIPHARLVIIEHCGHIAPLEQPEAVTAVMRYWLQL